MFIHDLPAHLYLDSEVQAEAKTKYTICQRLFLFSAVYTAAKKQSKPAISTFF